MKCEIKAETLPVVDIYELSNQIKRIQMITGTAIAILPTSASFCMIFLMRLCKEKQKIRRDFQLLEKSHTYTDMCSCCLQVLLVN